jgi:predicted Zn-dependent protease with MMP-like domain
MDQSEFAKLVEKAFGHLPEEFKKVIENVSINVEDYPSEEIVQLMKLRSKYDLLGLYQGIPLPHRGTWYGMSPVTPDKISLYKENIERESHGDIEETIREVLLHEIGHYFGMSEEQIRSAGY